MRYFLLTLLLLLFLLPRRLLSDLSFKVGAILEVGDQNQVWPIKAIETLEYARDNISSDLGIKIELVYIHAQCNTKTGLIQSTRRVVDVDQSDDVE